MAKEVMFTQFDDKEVRGFLENLDKKLKDIKDGKKEYVGLLSVIVFRDVNRHFDEQRGPSGGWDPWSLSYRKQMDAKGKGGNKILQDTGRLRQNFKPNKARQTSEGLLWFNDAQTKSGFPYAAHHDETADKTRPFMWLSNEAMDDVEKQTLAFMLDKGI